MKLRVSAGRALYLIIENSVNYMLISIPMIEGNIQGI
jgi:hypothetical protein